MSNSRIQLLSQKLHDTYNGKIEASALSMFKGEENEKNFLTKAFAAYALQILASITEDQAADAVTDGCGDGGIDAVYFREADKTLWLVQSKWKQDGKDGMDQGATLTFCNGIKKLLANDFTLFQGKIKNREPELSDIIDNKEPYIKIVLAVSGNAIVSKECQEAIDELLEYLGGKNGENASFEYFNLDHAYETLNVPATITEKIYLQNRGEIEDGPFKAVYGYVKGSFFAQLWNKYHSLLFNQNIRGFLGDSTVNEKIRESILNEPDRFFFYNNGITILCSSYKKVIPIKKNSSSYSITNLNIVNGAQTVGAIARANQTNPEAVDKIKVLVKIISLENSPKDFGLKVTTANNTQNKIEKRDFVSLDPEHKRLQDDLAVYNKTYYIKRSDEQSAEENACTAEDLIVAVACSLEDVDLSTQAKREVGLLWEDIETAPYKLIINPNLQAYKAWRCVQVMRKLNEYIARIKAGGTKQGPERVCIIHSRLFALHIILNHIESELNNENADFNHYIAQQLPDIIEKVETLIYTAVTKKFEDNTYVYCIFKNKKKCKSLKECISVKDLCLIEPIEKYMETK